MVVDLGADAKRLRERVGARGDDHELLEIEPVVGVRAAVDHVQQRHRQRPRRLAAELPIERLPGFRGRRLRSRERAAQDRIRAEPTLRRRSVEPHERLVETALIVGIAAHDRVGDLPVHVSDRLQDALAEIYGRVGVSHLDRLVLARRRPGRHGRPTERARHEPDVHLDRRVPARVEDLASVNLGDVAHASVSFARS